MQIIKLALLFLSSISIAVCHHKRSAFLKHVHTIAQFPCGDPKPRVFELKEVLTQKDIDKYEETEAKIHPPFTILHTCNSTGCCKDTNQRCGAAEREEVKLTFAVIHPKSIEYFSVDATNHTKCACSTHDYVQNAIK